MHLKYFFSLKELIFLTFIEEKFELSEMKKIYPDSNGSFCSYYQNPLPDITCFIDNVLGAINKYFQKNGIKRYQSPTRAPIQITKNLLFLFFVSWILKGLAKFPNSRIFLSKNSELSALFFTINYNLGRNAYALIFRYIQVDLRVVKIILNLSNNDYLGPYSI